MGLLLVYGYAFLVFDYMLTFATFVAGLVIGVLERGSYTVIWLHFCWLILIGEDEYAAGFSRWIYC